MIGIFERFKKSKESRKEHQLLDAEIHRLEREYRISMLRDLVQTLADRLEEGRTGQHPLDLELKAKLLLKLNEINTILAVWDLYVQSRRDHYSQDVVDSALEKFHVFQDPLLRGV